MKTIFLLIEILTFTSFKQICFPFATEYIKNINKFYYEY